MKAKFAAIVLVVAQSVVCAAQNDEIKYYAVLMEGAKVGYATHSRVASGGRITTRDTVDITVSRFGSPMNIKTSETCVETIKGEPISFSAEQALGMMITKTEATVGKDGKVEVRTIGMEGTGKSNFNWPSGAVMAEGLRLITLEKELREGTVYDVKIFSPGAMSAIDSRVKIGAKEKVDLFGRVVSLFKVETAMSMPGMGELVTVNYVDEQCEPLKTIMPMMDIKLELVACEKEFALGGNEAFDLADKMFVASPEIVEEPSQARSIGYVLKPTEPNGNLIIPAGDNQRVQKHDDGSIIVVVEPASMPKGGTFPYKGGDKELVEATKPSRFLQSDDAKVMELAGRAVGDTKDAGEAARQIEQFVADYVDTISLSIGYASAAEVAQSRKGDCSEFAVLCAAMCRASGIPARVVAGVAYTKNFMGKTGFGGHAWVEANISGKWIGLDPAFKKAGPSTSLRAGWGGFDAGHIALAWGDGEPINFFNVATTLGRFKIEKVIVKQNK